MTGGCEKLPATRSEIGQVTGRKFFNMIYWKLSNGETDMEGTVGLWNRAEGPLNK